MKPTDARYLKKGQVVVMSDGKKAVVQKVDPVTVAVMEGPTLTFNGPFPFEPIKADKPREIRVCVLSTAHLRPETLVLLNDTPISLWPVYGGPIPDGYFILAHEREPNIDYDRAPELLEVSFWALDNGYDYIRFDADEAPINQLPIYDHS